MFFLNFLFFIFLSYLEIYYSFLLFSNTILQHGHCKTHLLKYKYEYYQ